MNEVSISLFADTDIGMRRAVNEDSVLIADLANRNRTEADETISQALGERGYLMVVSDGMGGAAAGEVASDFAVNTLLEILANSSHEKALSEELKVAAERANERIWNYAQENPAMMGMGATLTAALACGATLHIAQVGDSRAYLIRDGKIEQLTRDQSLAQALVDSGMISADQAHLIPQNVIIQALGTQPSLNVVMSEIELCRHDTLVICSDGLSNKVKPQEMIEALNETADLKAAARWLIDKANERGGEDNITLIISRFDGDGLQEKPQGRRITGNFNAFDQNISYEEAAFIASKYVPTAPGEAESAEDEDEANSFQVTGVLRMPVNLTDEVIAESEATTASDSAVAERELFEKRPAFNERRTLMVMWIIAVISLLLLGIVGYYMLKPKPQPPPQVEQPADATANE
ncbi:MAG: serine/threonine-protein phosphatase [Acidobacteria bacterium]|nr:serine/threonine-protein phosphatase [Acidobacteriota bacterium]